MTLDLWAETGPHLAGSEVSGGRVAARSQQPPDYPIKVVRQAAVSLRLRQFLFTNCSLGKQRGAWNTFQSFLSKIKFPQVLVLKRGYVKHYEPQDARWVGLLLPRTSYCQSRESSTAWYTEIEQWWHGQRTALRGFSHVDAAASWPCCLSKDSFTLQWGFVAQ